MPRFSVRGILPLPAGTPPAIDGTPAPVQAIGSGASNAVNLGVSFANDVVVLVAFSNATSGTAPAISSITGTGDWAGLTWSNTASPTSGALTEVFTSDVDGTTSIRIEFWWAKQPNTGSNGSLTVTWGAGSDNTAYGVAAFSGCGNSNSPWDANGALPATSHSTGGATSTPSTPGISTSANGTMILCGVSASRAAGGQYVDQTAVAPFVLIGSVHFAPNVDFSALAWEREAVSSPQSGVTASFGVAYNAWITLAHALVGT